MVQRPQSSPLPNPSASIIEPGALAPPPLRPPPAPELVPDGGVLPTPSPPVENALPHEICGTVRVAAVPAPGGGWRALDEARLELLGTTCERVQSGEVSWIEAELPCGAVLR